MLTFLPAFVETSTPFTSCDVGLMFKRLKTVTACLTWPCMPYMLSKSANKQYLPKPDAWNACASVVEETAAALLAGWTLQNTDGTLKCYKARNAVEHLSIEFMLL